MSVSNYFLPSESYTWSNALLWGNCQEHFRQAREAGTLKHRVVHVLITLVEVLPVVGQIVSIFEKMIASRFVIVEIVSLIPEGPLGDVIRRTPQFCGYKLNGGRPFTSGPCVGHDVVLSGVSRRPSNLFLEALFQGTEITVTQPGSHQLFAFSRPHDEVRAYCLKKAAEDPSGVVEFSASGKGGHFSSGRHRLQVADLGEIFGTNTYRMSYQEIVDMLDSQHIYTSSLLPLEFYKGLKAAMKADAIVTLPGIDHGPQLLSEFRQGSQSHSFLERVGANPIEYGFTSEKAFQTLLEMTLYQIGSMVVKTENYQVFIDEEGKIPERNPGDRDTIRLINACGIRGIYSPKTKPVHNKTIMTETFKTALHAAGDGIVIFPAVGMGVWRGNPDLYWRAFLDAVVFSDAGIEQICINPNHQPSAGGRYQGWAGTEFQLILDEYKRANQENPEISARLNKVINLCTDRTDLMQLARNFKRAFPETTVSIFNASDPDVTLGNHVGEYVNNLPHGYTTEENYTAMGSNGLCFEGITGVHDSEDRLHHFGL